ncbi:putative membrane protein YhdT [Arthrobacter silviterrae]|uniref:Lipase maturation factor family protein n=1 Tax=Arthrobacter silviterrae TaxID=2026658 RepID=A0ABX0D7C4_9MICC|nr:lipase maturation factor family protein [Arthrobacter silviterrae]MDQ0276993.1 putative membrane protein YhdT [Arthrobacter silviterrae]NGN82781.1 lipase maturation factor family protein [Arthrobacter silviterrae]
MDWLGGWLGGWFGTADFGLARFVLQRGIAAIFLLAFVSSALQFPALLGEHGLLPVPRYLDRVARPPGPTLFRWRYSDTLLRTVAWTGAALGLSVVAGLPQRGPAWVPMAVFLAMWLLYMSIVNVGQVFYGFGWEILLLEAGFLAAFLGSNQTTTPAVTLWLFRWLVFRLEFGAGLIKMRGDPAWRDLTALYYHHETQPMPNPLSWFFHHLPRPLHKVEVLGNHLAQLVVPFFLFAPAPVSTVAAAAIILTQCWLVLSGNFAWLNAATIVLAFSAVATPAVPAVAPGGPGMPTWFAAVVLAVGALVLVLSWWPLRNLFSRHQVMNGSFNRWRLANAYGAFGSITRDRLEVVVEGTLGDPRGGGWMEYGFRGKPGEPGRMPRQWAPYQLRLDWQMWFLALGSPGLNWFVPFLNKLLDADPATLGLLRHDPFAGERPAWVRARVFSYRYTTWAEWRGSGNWWVREPLGELVPPVSRGSH